MAKHDDSLEVGLAAGLDIPTALVISVQEDEDSPRKGAGCALLAALLVVGFLVWCCLR